MILSIGLPVIAYLLGSISSAVLVCKAMGLSDPRTDGSGNPGATNVLRLHGKQAAAITLAGDVLKGFLPVLLARLLKAPDLIIALTGLFAFFGHLYPVFFNFQGGKGVATLIGVVFGLHWLIGVGFVSTWLFVALVFRYSSLAGLTATWLTPCYAWVLLHSPAYVICLSIMAAVLTWRHKANIKKLLAGTESRIGKKA